MVHTRAMWCNENYESIFGKEEDNEENVGAIIHTHLTVIITRQWWWWYGVGKGEKWDETEIELSFSDSYILLLRPFTLFFASREEITSSSSSLPHKFYSYQTDLIDEMWSEYKVKRMMEKKDISDSIRLLHTSSKCQEFMLYSATLHVLRKDSNHQARSDFYAIFKGCQFKI